MTVSFENILYRLNRAEAELRISKILYQNLFNADSNPIFIADSRTFEILDANEAAQNCYGYSKDELLQMSFFDLSDQADSGQADEDMGAGFASIKAKEKLLYSKRPHRKKNGDLFYVNVHLCSTEYMDSTALIITTHDITEHLETKAQLIQASKMSTLGIMASGIAHELNQPLNVIKVGSDFFLKMTDRNKEIDKETLRTMAEEMSRYVDRASAIISHLKEFARASDVKGAELNINQPVRDVFKILGRQLTLHEISVELDLADHLPCIFADHNRLEQVFVNLVTNARDALEERGVYWQKMLRVRTFIEDKRVVAIVSDNGKGIREDIMDKIFEPFFTTKEADVGTGLGLSISYGIVKDYEGEITVESKYNEGTSCKVSFPAIV
ncbi:MAG: PAS domain S-box protein [Desulfobacterales bacterium]|nr:PAS domain S-box protein [Desulfobacterales bacterium]